MVTICNVVAGGDCDTFKATLDGFHNSWSNQAQAENSKRHCSRHDRTGSSVDFFTTLARHLGPVCVHTIAYSTPDRKEEAANVETLHPPLFNVTSRVLCMYVYIYIYIYYRKL